MNQPELKFDVPQPGELFKYGSQNYALYQALLQGGVTNVEMRDLFILSHTRRLTDVREAIRPYLMDVKKERLHGGVYLYKLSGGPRHAR